MMHAATPVYRRAWFNQAVLALLAFAAGQAVLAWVLHRYTDVGYFWPQNWLRWDSGHYLSIAENGYQLLPCSQVPGFDPASPDTCGNAGWFAGYPFLLRALAYLTGDYVVTAGIVSKLFLLVSLFMAVKLAGFDSFSPRALLFAPVTSFSFSFVYHSAVFPMSGVVCFALCAYYFAARGKYLLSALFCFLAALFYPVGILLAASLALWQLLHTQSVKQRLVYGLLTGLAGLAGLLAFFGILQVAVGNWRGFLLVQDKYAHAYQNPRMTLDFFIRQFPHTLARTSAMAYQTLLTYIFYVSMTVFFVYRRMYRVPLYRWAYLYFSVFLWFSLCQAGNYSRFRSESLLLPAFLLLKEAPAWALAGISVLLLAVGIPMAYLFFTGVLI